MRRYETTYILRPNLGEDQFSEIIERTNSIIKDDGGTIINLEQWGSKKLAYEIRKETLGFYISFDFAAHGSTVHEMERIFRIDDRVLRYLTIKLADSIDEETIAKEVELVTAAVAEKTAEAEESLETPESSKTAETSETSEEVDTPANDEEAEGAGEEKEADEPADKDQDKDSTDDEQQDDQDNPEGEK